MASLALAGVARVQRVAATEEVLPFSKLELVLRTDATVYTVGQPIALYAEVANRHGQPVDAHEFFGWEYRGGTLPRPNGGDLLVVEMAWERSKFQRYVGQSPLRGSGPPLPASPMAPRTTRKCKLLLMGAGDGAAPLDKSGTLQIRAEFHHVVAYEQKIVSEPVRVSLKRPAVTEGEAYRWLRDRRMLRLLGYVQSQVYYDLDILALKGFVERYPNTVYAPYARFGVGQICLEKKQYEEAIGIFEDLIKRHPKASIAEDAAYLLGECYFQQHKAVDADRWFRETIKRFPGTPAALDAEEVLLHVSRMPDMLFRDDRRLDVEIKVRFEELTPLDEVFRLVLAIGGVPLRVSPDLQGRTMKGGGQAMSLRKFMYAQAGYRAAWIREDDGGYRLIPSFRPDWPLDRDPSPPKRKPAKPPAAKPAIPGDEKAERKASR